MKRVLVPLDGSELAESIIPDARRVAGPDGKLILVRQINHGNFRPVEVSAPDITDIEIERAESYLDGESALLRSQGIKTEVHSLVLADPAAAIDEAARIFKADLIAIATHGRGPFGRLVHGGVAWKALSHGSVPVLLRHVETPVPPPSTPEEKRTIMVPLDGSEYGERVLPFAQELSREWDATIHLVRVVSNFSTANSGIYVRYYAIPDSAFEEDVVAAKAYLDNLASKLEGDVRTSVVLGPIVGTLIELVDRLAITDVIMATHGRTGLSRVVLGSVADDLIRELHIPVIVIPSLATLTSESEDADVVEAGVK